jgi:hypothetical protein
VFLPYVGGVGRYREICERVAADGYDGFSLRSTSSTVAGRPEIEGGDASSRSA